MFSLPVFVLALYSSDPFFLLCDFQSRIFGRALSRTLLYIAFPFSISISIDAIDI
jgi:hypothetical protein